MYKQGVGDDSGQRRLYEGGERFFNKNSDFGERKVDVILGDNTHCTLDFPDSQYLKKLPLNMKPVKLPFGSSASLRKLSGIATLLRKTGCVGCDDYAKVQEKSAAGATRSVVDGAAVRAVAGGTAKCTVHESVEDWDSALLDYVRGLTENRREFMSVIELAACLEMNTTLSLLCFEFRRIFEEEVRSAFPCGLLSLAQKSTCRLQEVARFCEVVTRVFALDVDAASSSSSLTRLKKKERHSEGLRTDALTHRLQTQLENDEYLFPETSCSIDLTQSVGWEAFERRCKTSGDGVFFPKVEGHLFMNPTWEADDVRRVCPVCGKAFAKVQLPLFDTVRASHCRCCGQRICKNCTLWKLDKSIAKLSKPGAPEEGQLRHACKKCYDKAEPLNRNAFLCEIFVRSGLALTEIALLCYVNEQWGGAAELCLSDYRSLLYQSASLELSVAPQTAGILASSVNILVGHPESLIYFFLSLDWKDQALVAAAHNVLNKTVLDAAMEQPTAEHNISCWKPAVSHWHMLCTRSCSLMLPSFFAIKILESLHRAPKGNPVAESMRMLVTEKLLLDKVPSLNFHVCECIAVLLLDIFELETCQEHATSVLLKLAERDQRLALVICQEAAIRPGHDDLSYCTLREFVLKTNGMVRRSSHEKFVNTLQFLKVLASSWKITTGHLDVGKAREVFLDNLYAAGLRDDPTDTSEEELVDNGAVLVKPFLFPFDTNVVVRYIDINAMEAKNSRQRPILIPFICADKKRRHILFKGECLEKDKVMCIASRFLQWVLHKQLGEVELPTYHVMPLSPTSGIIEIVEDGQTIQHVIDQCSEHRLLQHLMQLEEQQQQQQIRHYQRQRQEQEKRGLLEKQSSGMSRVKVRDCFLHSAKFFILMNYIFAIADRHRDNVLVHSSGAIFHIDFGMILTTRTFVEQVTTGYVRFDKDLEESVLKFMHDNAHERQRKTRHLERQHGVEKDDTAVTNSSNLLRKFLMETADWFLEVRPHAGILCQLLSHVVSRQALDDVRSFKHLAEIMQTVFIRYATVDTCKNLFCDRVEMSRRQTWLKDLTHDTHKRTWSIVSFGYNWLREKAGFDRSDVMGACDAAVTASPKDSSSSILNN